MKPFIVMSFATATLIACMAFALADANCERRTQRGLHAESGPSPDGPLASSRDDIRATE